MAKLTAASGGRSSPSHLPATPNTRSVRTAAMIMIGSWTRRLVDRREDLTPMQTTANATPTPIRTASSRSTSAGGCACQIPNETAPMMAATAVPLTRASFKDPARRGVARAPNKVSAELGSEVTCLANSMKDNGRALELLPIHAAPRRWGELAAKPLGGVQATRGPLLAVLGLGPLRHRPLERRAAAGVKGVDLVAVAVLAGGLAPPGGGVEGPQLRQALLFGGEGRLERVRKLGVVHGDDPEPRLELEDLNLSSGQFEIDGFRHCSPLLYGSKLLKEITTPQQGKLCHNPYPH